MVWEQNSVNLTVCGSDVVDLMSSSAFEKKVNRFDFDVSLWKKNFLQVTIQKQLRTYEYEIFFHEI